MNDFILECPLSNYPGSLSLPHPDEVTGVQFDDLRQIENDRDAREYDHEKTLKEEIAFKYVEFAAIHGSWSFENPTLDEFMTWDTEREKMKVRFVMWLGKQLFLYHRMLLDPKG
jgi:hypothetical protein